MHRSVLSALKSSRQRAAEIARVRVTYQDGESFVWEREEFLSHNADLHEDDIADIRAGRPVRIGGGAAPIVDIMPVMEAAP